MTRELDAKASDPRALGLMQGFPPQPDKIVRVRDGTNRLFPQTRWAFSHQRELGPTALVWRGTSPSYALPHALRDDLDGVTFETLDGVRMTRGQSLDANFTDGMLVMHRGKVVYERYFGALEPHIPHIAFSVTKSFVGVLAAMLAHEGELDVQRPTIDYVPELAGTAFADATVRQVMDMTTDVQYSENYTDPNAEAWAYGVVVGVRPRPANYAGPATIYDFMRTLKKSGEHGAAFAYKTCNTEVLGWIVQRVAAQPLAKLLSERIWQRLGVEENADLIVDGIGAAQCGSGLNITLRDLARFGEMMRCGGAFNGHQIVPAAVVADISGGADPALFAKAGYVTLPGWSYRSQWWVTHNHLGAYSARGIYGQAIYIAPRADVVIVRYASHPTAANGNGPLDRVSLPAYLAIAEHLRRT